MIALTPINSGDTSWVLICAGLVLFMTPGLAFFYAGMVRGRNALVMMQQNFIPLGVISLTWIFVGYSLSFGNDAGSGFIGNLGHLRAAEPRERPGRRRFMSSRRTSPYRRWRSWRIR